MGGHSLGKLEIITPAAILDLEIAEVIEINSKAKDENATPAPSKPKEPTADTHEVSAVTAEVAAEVPVTPKRAPFADAKKVADVVLKATISQVAEEVGVLLGEDFVCNDLKLEMVSKEEFFGKFCLEKSILTDMDVSGAVSGKIYLCQQIQDAILMGGTLIMLPDDEIQNSISKNAFDGEVADAYGEIANIISGGLTQSFLDRFPRQLRFVKKTAETIIPTKLNLAEETPFPTGDYYLASCAINLQGNALDRMHLLFPAEILGLERQESQTETATAQPKAAAESKTAETSKAQTTPTRQPAADAKPILLVITDVPESANAISLNLKNDKYDIKVIGYKDDVRAIFSTHPVLGVFLLMSEVGERGFSVAIKLQSSGYKMPPMIAGGPEWTRSAVLRAVKYGARDILVTPASDDEIRTKASQHMPISA